MSIDPIYTVWCDSCQTWCQLTAMTRAEAWSNARGAGWRKVAGRHLCPRCLTRTTPPPAEETP